MTNLEHTLDQPLLQIGNDFIGHILASNPRKALNEKHHRQKMLAEIEATIRNQIIDILLIENPTISATAFAEITKASLYSLRFSIRKQALKIFEAEHKQKNIDPHFQRFITFMIGLYGFRDLDSIWFEKLPQELDLKEKSPKEKQYWQSLFLKSQDAMQTLFPGPISDPSDLPSDQNGLLTANNLLKASINHLPLDEETFRHMVKSVLWLKTMHLTDIFNRKYESPRSRAITKHLRAQIETYASAEKMYKKIKFLKNDQEIIYEPTTDQVQKIGIENLEEGIIVISDADIDKCPLFQLANFKDFFSAILKLFDTDKLYNPGEVNDYVRGKFLFTNGNKLERPYQPKNETERLLIKNNDYVARYKELAKEADHDQNEIYSSIATSDFTEEEQTLLGNIHLHFWQEAEERCRKIIKVLGTTVEFIGSTHREEKIKDGFMEGKTNQDSLGEIHFFKGESIYRPTYNLDDLMDTLEELSTTIQGCPRILNVCTNLAKNFIHEHHYWRKMLVLKFLDAFKNKPLQYIFPLIKAPINFLLRNFEFAVPLYADKGSLYQALMEAQTKLLRKKNISPEDQKALTALQKCIALIEELDEIKDFYRPFLNFEVYAQDETTSFSVPKLNQDPNFRNFSNAGHLMNLEWQIRNYLDEESHRLDQDKYKDEKRKRIGKENLLRWSKNVDEQVNYEPITYSQFIEHLLDCFCKNFPFDYHDRTRPSNLMNGKSNRNFEKNLSVRENTKLLLLRILANPKNTPIIRELCAETETLGKIGSFMAVCLQEYVDPELDKYRRKRTQPRLIMNIINNSEYKALLFELRKNPVCKKILESFLEKISQERKAEAVRISTNWDQDKCRALEKNLLLENDSRLERAQYEKTKAMFNGSDNESLIQKVVTIKKIAHFMEAPGHATDPKLNKKAEKKHFMARIKALSNGFIQPEDFNLLWTVHQLYTKIHYLPTKEERKKLKKIALIEEDLTRLSIPRLEHLLNAMRSIHTPLIAQDIANLVGKNEHKLDTFQRKEDQLGQILKEFTAKLRTFEILE